MTFVALDLDATLGDTRPLWRAWLEDAARRYASIAPLDLEALPADRGAAAEELDRWAQAGVGDWRVSLGRFAEDRAPVYVRRSAEASDAVRRLAAAGVRLGAFTDAPDVLARVVAAHLGVERRLESLEAGPGALERLLEHLGGDATVVHARDELVRLAYDLR